MQRSISWRLFFSVQPRSSSSVLPELGPKVIGYRNDTNANRADPNRGVKTLLHSWTSGTGAWCSAAQGQQLPAQPGRGRHGDGRPGPSWSRRSPTPRLACQRLRHGPVVRRVLAAQDDTVAGSAPPEAAELVARHRHVCMGPAVAEGCVRYGREPLEAHEPL